MLRLDLLRDLGPAPKAKKPGSGAARRALIAALVLLVAGAALLLLARPEWRDPSQWPSLVRGNAAAKADSLRRLEALRGAASRSIDASLGLASAWLDQFETLPPENDGWTLGLASFTPPDRFLIRGVAHSGEVLSALQEALVLFPGADLKASTAEKLAGAADAHAFEFSGTVRLEADSAFGADRTVPSALLPAALDSLAAAAAAHGIALATPAPRSAAERGGLELRAYRAAGTCDSAGFEGLRNFLAYQRLKGAPFGIQRMILERRKQRTAVFLDIMAFVR